MTRLGIDIAVPLTPRRATVVARRDITTRDRTTRVVRSATARTSTAFVGIALALAVAVGAGVLAQAAVPRATCDQYGGSCVVGALAEFA